MDDIARELGVPPGRRFAVALTGMFVTGVGGFSAAQAMISDATRLYVGVHLGSWLLWFAWHGVIFPRARERFLARSRTPYASAFYTNIWPGVCWGLSQMTAPAVLAVGDRSDQGPLTQLFALSVVVLGFTLLTAGVRAIGVARVGFLGEYRTLEPALCGHRIYGLMRHPLFVGGALVSLGATAALCSSAVALSTAAINVAILPVYSAIEDRRLAHVFGNEYVQYARTVGGIAPRATLLGVAVNSIRLRLAAPRR
jgi:protein-S-isoprenylcysteine O-methyltransferase Ste14